MKTFYLGAPEGVPDPENASLVRVMEDLNEAVNELDGRLHVVEDALYWCQIYPSFKMRSASVTKHPLVILEEEVDGAATGVKAVFGESTLKLTIHYRDRDQNLQSKEWFIEKDFWRASVGALEAARKEIADAQSS